MPEKTYKASINVNDFHYAVLDSTDKVVDNIERVKFLKEITVEAQQEIAKAFGDGEVAEMATSNGPMTVSGSFHKIPQEDKDKIFGLKKIGKLSSYGPDSNPPYVAIVFTIEDQDGGKGWYGLAKGKFTMPSVSGTTKEESIEFGNEEVEGEFMSRVIQNERVMRLSGEDAPGETEVRDEIFQAIFGKPYPDSETEPEEPETP